jgi:hypothetical protein
MPNQLKKQFFNQHKMLRINPTSYQISSCLSHQISPNQSPHTQGKDGGIWIGVLNAFSLSDSNTFSDLLIGN